MNTVLMIDDDKELCSLIKKCLDNEEISTLIEFSGSEGLKVVDEKKDNLSLIILDVMLPDLDGFSILKKIREVSNVPVLMLTAKIVKKIK
ncbi:response regulator [Paraclostridium benzoelyticum]|uniref:response regulator n=1 Tax=Paraclostridium benzoelyticum TaxID=1629550 RepID=UPI003D68EBA7